MEIICPNCEHPVVIVHKNEHDEKSTCCPACKQVITIPEKKVSEKDDVKEAP